MLFYFNFYSSFLLVFFIHTIVYGILFLVRYKRESQPSSLWLGFFLILAALYISPWMLGFAGWYGTQPYRDLLFYLPFQQLFLIGPFIFFYVSSLFNPQFRLRGKLWLHFLPAALYLLFCLVMVVYDKLIVHHYYFLIREEDPDFADWYQITGFLSMITYFIASIRYYYGYKRAIEAVMSNAAEFLFAWVRNFLVAFLLILVAWLVIELAGLFFMFTYNSSWWYFLGFSLCCYYIAIAGYSNSVETRLFMKRGFFQSERSGFYLKSNPGSRLGYAAEVVEEIHLDDSPFLEENEPEDYSAWKDRIEQLLKEELLYQDPDLSLFDLAKKLTTNVSLLSKIINRGFNSNFNDLINSYRIKQYVELLNKGEHKRQTLLSLAFECGFNSKTTFNRAFRKQTGLSPQQYIKTNKL